MCDVMCDDKKQLMCDEMGEIWAQIVMKWDDIDVAIKSKNMPRFDPIFEKLDVHIFRWFEEDLA